MGCQMESVRIVYQRHYHPDFPFVCLDEAMKQLVSETAIPIPVQPGQPERFDYQYERHGTANLFMLCNPIIWMANRRSYSKTYCNRLCSTTEKRALMITIPKHT